jgi:hypothetical protein
VRKSISVFCFRAPGAAVGVGDDVANDYGAYIYIITHAFLTERDLVEFGSVIGGVPLVRIGEPIGLPPKWLGLLTGGSSPFALNSSIICRASGDNGGERITPDFVGVDAHRHLSFKSTLVRV